MSSLDVMMNRISGLLAKADSTEFPEEAATYRAKAEELMARYRIEEETLIATTGESLPVRRTIPMTEGGEFRHAHSWLWSAVARHCGVKYITTYAGASQWIAEAVGYDVDLRLAQMIFTSARLVFGAHLEPEIDASLTDAENVYRLRSAGIERNRIAQMMWGSDLGHAGHAAHARVGRLYREACESRGEDAAVSGRRVNARSYRESYAQQFVTQFETRLWRARDAADSVTGGVVLHGRSERVQEAFYVTFPHLRPKPQPETVETTTAAKKAKPVKDYRPTKADEQRWYRQHYSPTAVAAGAAAKSAASKIALDRPQQASRVDAPRAGKPQELGA